MKRDYESSITLIKNNKNHTGQQKKKITSQFLLTDAKIPNNSKIILSGY